jgi:hypothetical protein
VELQENEEVALKKSTKKDKEVERAVSAFSAVDFDWHFSFERLYRK